jgi:threonine dehydratase
LVEPSGAATTAALRAGLLEQYRRPPVVLVVSGGNVDPALLEDRRRS